MYFPSLVSRAGPIPEALGALTNLTELKLRCNQLKGAPVALLLLVRLLGSPRQHVMCFALKDKLPETRS